MARTTITEFQPKEWLREALGEEHSPLKVSDFESREALNEIRRDVSGETNPRKRAELVRAYRAETIDDSDFVRLVGKRQSKVFRELFGQPDSILLYEGGGALDRPSPIREDLLNFLAGIDHVYRARDLAEKVPDADVDVALAQIGQALAQLDKAMQRLPKTPSHKDTASRFRSMMEQASARLRQPVVAEAADKLATMKFRPFTHATLADTGVSQKDFKALRKAAEAAIKRGSAKAVDDITMLWQATKAGMGYNVRNFDYEKGFRQLKYSGDPAGPSFQKDVKQFEAYLDQLSSFRPGDQRPAR